MPVCVCVCVHLCKCGEEGKGGFILGGSKHLILDPAVTLSGFGFSAEAVSFQI